MEYQLSRKGNLPACAINAKFMEDLWHTLSQEGEFIWNAVVGSGTGSRVKPSERPQVIVHDWAQLIQMLSSQNVDYFQLTVEYTDKGTLSFAFKNYDPAGGSVVVAGTEQGWIDARYAAITSLFHTAADPFITKLYNRYGSFLLHSVIPLVLAFIIVVIAAAILIPGDIRRSDFIWWITAGTVVATLKVGQMISDRLIAWLLVKYPYLRWQQ